MNNNNIDYIINYYKINNNNEKIKEYENIKN